MLATLPLLEQTDFPALRRTKLETLQVNLGYRCNQACLHCHVNAGPTRKESMSKDNIDVVVDFLRSTSSVHKLDLTGGAPELNPHFRELVARARDLDVAVMDRCNLTILSEPGHEDLGEFLAKHQVEVVASLPCYLEENVDKQRGKGVFGRSINGLRQLNELGFGQPDSGLTLNLVYNPQEAVLPPPQPALEAAYKAHLKEQFNVVFNRLFTITNMPIQRFGSTLLSKGHFADYMRLLKTSHDASNLDNVMCRSLLSVDWQGYVYDCDFNQMLALPLRYRGTSRTQLKELIGVDLNNNPIVVREHCYGCTAGQGSSCGGALG